MVFPRLLEFKYIHHIVTSPLYKMNVEQEIYNFFKNCLIFYEILRVKGNTGK